MTPLEAIQAFFAAFQPSDKRITFWIAYSGGMDSHVLLSLCHAVRKKYNLSLRAIYVDHGTALSKDWTVHTQHVCAALEIDYQVQKLNFQQIPEKNIEAVWRQARYQALLRATQPGDVLLTAHHEEDQAETFLLQLFRGAGIKGLSAMPLIKPFGLGFHGRPLLSVSHDALYLYAKENGLHWVEDPSNEDVSYSRNFLRHQILPLIAKRYPAISSTLARSAQMHQEAQVFIDETVKVHWQQAIKTGKNKLSIAYLCQLNSISQRFLLRFWLQENNVVLPNEKKLREIQRSLMTAKSDRTPLLTWHEVELRRYRDELYIQQKFNQPVMDQPLYWEVAQSLSTHFGVLFAQEKRGAGIALAIKKVEVRFRAGGEKIYYHGHHRSVKKLLQEKGIPPWERNRIPFIFYQGQLIAVGDRWLDDRYAVSENATGWLPVMA